MKRTWTFGLLLLGIGIGVSADPNDFVHGRLIELDEVSAVQKVTVPEDVYLWVTRADLGDLRVLNGDGEEVPYALHRPQTTEEFTEWEALPVFVIPGSDSGAEGVAQIHVEVDGGGAVVAVSSILTAQEKNAAYLLDLSGWLDLSGVAEGLSQLQVRWDGEQDFVGQFRIDASDDLNVWRTIVGSEALARLATDGQRVLMDQIDLPSFAARYLKITQLEGSEPVQVGGVAIRRRQSQLPDRHWRQLTGVESEGGYEFTTGGRFPADRIRVELDQENYLLTAKIYSRPRAEGVAWRDRGKHTFYRIQVNGHSISSDSVQVVARDRFWRVEMVGKTATPPSFRIEWVPDEIVFLKQGATPFLLVYGQAGLQGRQWPMTELLSRLGNDSNLDSVPGVSLGAVTTLGGQARLNPPPQPVDWQTVLLWLVLVVGVGVVGFFASRLLRE